MKAARTEVLLFAGVIVALWAGSAGATDLSGDCTTSLDPADCPYTLTGTLTVPTGETCTVPATCTLNCQGNSLVVDGTLVVDGAVVDDCGWTVRGELQATGATLTRVRGMLFESGSTATIVDGTVSQNRAVCSSFKRSVPDTGQGNKWVFLQIRSTAVVLRNVALTMGHDSWWCPQYGLLIEDASPTVEGNTLTATSYRDYETYFLIGVVNGAPVLADNTLSGPPGQTGLHLVDVSPTVTGNTISGASIGIRVSGSSQPQMSGNTLRGMT